jgi:hypothetical protein
MWLEGVLHHRLIACGGLWWLIGKTAVFLWFLCGENVVECVVNVVKKQRVFGERIVGHLFRFYFLKVRGDPLRGAGGNFSGVFGVLFSGYAEAVMQTNMQMKRSLAVVAVLGMVLVSGCRIESDKHGDNDNVKIATPFGGMDIKTNDAAVVAEIGLPMYPGAVLVKKKQHNDGAADINMSFGSFQLRVKAASYTTPDSPDKVAAFYRKALGRYGDVIDCQNNKALGSPAKTAEGLTCDNMKENHITVDEEMSDKRELKAGSKQHQHIVSIDSDGGGSKMGLVALDLPGHFSFGDNNNDDDRQKQ